MDERPTAVVDANVLLNLATPVVDGRQQAPSGEDPLRVVLTVYDVHVPAEVLGEITSARGGDDLLATAADAVTKASHHLQTHDVGAEVDGGLEYGLDPGESRAIWLANDIEVELFVTDEFGAGHFPLIALALEDTETLFTTPHVLCKLAEQGILDPAYVDAVLSYLAELKHWDRQYIDRLRGEYLAR
jgi:hypothetical protein